MGKSDDTVPKERSHEEFYREVGELVFWFAASENAVYMLANQLIGKDDVARVVMKNVHLARAIDLIRELARVRYKDSPHLAKYEAGLLKFKECAKERNALLHGVALPSIDAASGEEVLQIASIHTLKLNRKKRSHIGELREKLRKCTLEFFQAAFDLGLFQPRRRRTTAEQGVAPAGRPPSAPARR